MQGNHIEEINNGCLKIDFLQDDGCLEMVSDLETSTVSYKPSIKVEGSKIVMLLDDTLNMHERLSHPPFPTVMVG